MENVPIQYKINDNRDKKKFKTHTFGGYKKNQVLSQWKKAIENGTIDKAIYWTVELDISGVLDTLWTHIIKYMSTHIGVKNPKLPYYLWKRYSYYLESKKRCDNILLFRNNQVSRNHLSEVICVICLSEKQTLCKLPKIHEDDFSLTKMKSKIKCEHFKNIRDIMKIDDPKEFMIPINEIYYYLCKGDHSSDTREMCLYWLSWLYEFCKKNNNNKITDCVPRLVNGVDDKFTKDVMWIIWEIIFSCIKQLPKNNIIQELYRQITCLFYFYKQNYTSGKKNSRKCYIIHAILLCINTVPNINFTKEIFVSYSTILTSCMKINNIYEKLSKPRKVMQTYSEPIKKKKSPVVYSMFSKGV